MAHWVFSAQYLKTSLTLPKLFSTAKLEYLFNDSEQDSIRKDLNRLQEELAKYDDICVDVFTPIDTFRKFDSVIKELKKKVRRIDKFILILSLFMSGVTIGVFALSNYAILYQVGAAAVLLFSGFVLIYSVFSIRKMIRRIEHALPNERLVILHMVNFLLFILFELFLMSLSFASATMNQIDTPEEQLTLLKLEFAGTSVGLFNTVYSTYMEIFLLYLIMVFTRERQNLEMTDTVLGKKVPSIVFIQNQKLLKDTIKNELTNDARSKR